MPWMNFDLEDGKPPVRFSLKDEDCERFMEFMAECHAWEQRAIGGIAHVTLPLKDHEVRELVNGLVSLARNFHNHDSLRDRMSEVVNTLLKQIAAGVRASDEDLRDTITAIFAAVGYTEEYARQWPKEKASITFKRWFDEQLEAARTNGVLGTSADQQKGGA